MIGAFLPEPKNRPNVTRCKSSVLSRCLNLVRNRLFLLLFLLSDYAIALCFVSGLLGRCLQKLERVKGIEPSSQAWEAHILPLNHTRTEVTLPKALLACNRTFGCTEPHAEFRPLAWSKQFKTGLFFVALLPDPRWLVE